MTSSAIPASGNYDFEFRLFDALSGGTQQGTTVQRPKVAVANGVFSVSLDFGPSVFSGANRFLDISVREVGGGAYSQLAPRQQIQSTPYAVRSLNASAADALSPSCVGCVTATQVGSVNGSAVTGTIPVSGVPAGSGSYIQNATTQQATSNFNVSGTGSASLLNARMQFQLNGERILAAPGIQNTVVGLSTAVGFGGENNSVFGYRAGRGLVNGSDNSYFGVDAGAATQFGGVNGNAFFGKGAGISNNDGDYNSFVGYHAGQANTSGDYNSFFGMFAGQSNTIGSFNSFFGHYAGRFSTGNQNTFVGQNTGLGIGSGGQNTALGWGIVYGLDSLSYSTVIGAGAIGSTSNTIQLGRSGMDVVRVGLFSSGGSATVCSLASALALCGSSRRYKENIISFGGGLDIVKRLQPITFDWRESKAHDLGLIAEEVAAIDALLVTYNPTGEVEGVKYDKLTVVLINAVKDQQTHIERLQKLAEMQTQELGKVAETNSELRLELNELKKMICSLNTTGSICKK